MWEIHLRVFILPGRGTIVMNVLILTQFDFLMTCIISLPLSYFRIVQPELKALAMGFHSMVIRTLGMTNI